MILFRENLPAERRNSSGVVKATLEIFDNALRLSHRAGLGNLPVFE
ncbi:hypothetical protein [Streptococcus ruminicola]|nr:hypothetical protein [Streptococcus ruminicola]